MYSGVVCKSVYNSDTNSLTVNKVLRSSIKKRSFLGLSKYEAQSTSFLIHQFFNATFKSFFEPVCRSGNKDFDGYSYRHVYSISPTKLPAELLFHVPP